MIVVITYQTSPHSMADTFLPPTTHTYTRGSMSHRMYTVDDGEMDDQEYRDPFDGALIVSYHSFPTEEEAHEWIRSAERVQ